MSKQACSGKGIGKLVEKGSGKITAISLLIIIGLSILGVITALSGNEVKEAVSPAALQVD